MADQGKPARPKAESTGAGRTPMFASLLEANLEAVARWFNSVDAFSQEITRFTRNRLQEDMAVWTTMASCKSPEEAVECQRRFAETATAQYTEELTKLSQMVASAATESFSQLGRAEGLAPRT